jgi:hypothetical protein
LNGIVTAFNGSASNVGQNGGSAILISENFTFNGNINLQTATLTVVNVLQEVGGAGELLPGIPITLTYGGTDPNDGPFYSAPGANPAYRFNVKIQDPQQAKWTSKLRIDNAALPNFATKCAMVSSNNYRTNLVTTYRINPAGGGTPLSVTTTQSWQCRDFLNSDPNQATTLRAP